MHELHRSLLEQIPLYRTWHEQKIHHLAHWWLFVVVAVFLSSSFIAEFNSWNSPLTAAVAQADEPTLNSLPLNRVAKAEAAHGQILVKFNKSAVPWTRQDVLRRHSLKEKLEIPNIGVKIVNISSDDTPEEVVQRLITQEKRSIEFAEVDSVASPDLIPNDPYFSSAWHLSKMETPAAWDTATGQNLVVAVLDSGIDCAHPDLSANCVAGWNVFDGNNDTTDKRGHGTTVAGVISAVGDNSIGAVGVAYKAKLMPVVIASSTTGYCYSSTAAQGLIYAADHNAKVANISYSSGCSFSSQTVTEAAKYFRSKGGVVVASAGNQGTVLTAPASPEFIVVGATDKNDALTSWSNTGSVIDFVAPGSNIVTTAPNGSYGYAAGTSYSSPLVGAVAALAFSANPKLSIADLENILKLSSDDLGMSGWDAEFGFGRVNAFKSVQLACAYSGSVCAVSGVDSEPPLSPQGIAASAPDSSGVNLSWLPSTDNVKVAGYTVYRSDVDIADVVNTYYKDSSIVPGHLYIYYIKAFDDAGNLSIPSAAVSITVPSSTSADTEAPTVPASLSASALDSTKITLTWAASSDNVGVAGYKIYRNNSVVGSAVSTAYTDATVSAGAVYTYTLRAYDGAGNLSQPSSGVGITVPAVTDSTPPTAPANFTAVAFDNTRVDLAWSASTDDVGVRGYTIYRDGALRATTTARSWNDTNVTAGATHTYYLTAYDAAGNVSGASNTVSVIVPASAVKPITITSFQVTKKSATTAVIAFTTSVSTTGTVVYGETANLGSGISDPVSSVSHTITLTNLFRNTKYYYKISVSGADGVTVSTPISTFRTTNK